MREMLDYQADQIERVLASHGVPGRVYGGAVSPRLVEFHVAPAPGVKIARIEGLAEELAMYLGVGACRVQRRGSVVAIEVPKDRPPIVKLLSLLGGLRQSVPAATAVLGQDNEGLPILLRMPSPDVAHALITGTTGSGKTELAKSMILGLALCNSPEAVRMLLIDPKGRGYRAFADLPHLVCPVITDVDEAHQRLEGLVGEMERRDRAGQSDPRVLVFMDEMADLMMVGGKQMVQTMTRLTQRGREAGIHIVACTQKPTAAIVGGLVKSNFPARLVGSVASADDARIAAGISASGAEKLAGRGDFLLVVKGDVQRIQAAYTPPDELQAAVSRLAAAYARLPRAASPVSKPLDSEVPPLPLAPAGETTHPWPDGSQPVLPHDIQICDESDDAGDCPDDEDGAPPAPARAGADAAVDPFVWRPISQNLRLGQRRG